MERTEKDRYSREQILEALNTISSGWQLDEKENTIVKEYARKNFMDAITFIQRIAPIAEQQDHHPDLYLHGYKNVRVILTTHSAKGITQNDFDLAREIDKL